MHSLIDSLYSSSDAFKKGSKNRHRKRTFLDVISRVAFWIGSLPEILMIAFCLWTVKILNEPGCDMNRLMVIDEVMDLLTKPKGNSTASATTDEESDSEASDN